MAIGVTILGDESIAVVVDSVADLLGAWMNGPVHVVTIVPATARREVAIVVSVDRFVLTPIRLFVTAVDGAGNVVIAGLGYAWKARSRATLLDAGAEEPIVTVRLAAAFIVATAARDDPRKGRKQGHTKDKTIEHVGLQRRASSCAERRVSKKTSSVKRKKVPPTRSFA
jgi:hypothetical protein